MRTGIFLEYLGDVDTELLLQNLTNTNENFSSIDTFREAFPAGFMVSAQIEQRIYETPEEKKVLVDFMRDRLQRAGGSPPDFTPPGRKLIGLVLSPRAAVQ